MKYQSINYHVIPTINMERIRDRVVSEGSDFRVGYWTVGRNFNYDFYTAANK
jgi:hypothetical protein